MGDKSLSKNETEETEQNKVFVHPLNVHANRLPLEGLDVQIYT